MKVGTYIKHESSMDICYRVKRIMKGTDKYHILVSVYNMGFTKSWVMDSRMIINFPFDEAQNWRWAWTPMKCMRNATWLRILK